ncbi:PilZ domain-containing protein [Tsuneonella sp. SYSU-LHT278]|uniref:PilZ domain-containing protein n=1 Tax=Tsuneonella sediminis TaxID=3416089 RepID=UPI003F79FB70
MHAEHEPATMTAGAGSRDRRGDERIVSGASAIARIPASPHRVTLVDVSRTGCQIRVDGLAVPLGATVNLDFGPGRQITGQVMWAQPRTAGIRFDRTLSAIMAAALGVEPAVGVEIEEVCEKPPVQERALRLPHWLRSLLGRAA